LEQTNVELQFITGLVMRKEVTQN